MPAQARSASTTASRAGSTWPRRATPLYEFSARDYAPALGTFSSLDSVLGSAGSPRSMNRFLYALANPATLIDPTGHGVDTGIDNERFYAANPGTAPTKAEKDRDYARQRAVAERSRAGGGSTRRGPTRASKGATPPTTPKRQEWRGPDERAPLSDRESLHVLWLYSRAIVNNSYWFDRSDEDDRFLCDTWGSGPLGGCGAPVIDPSSDLGYALFGDPFREMQIAGPGNLPLRAVGLGTDAAKVQTALARMRQSFTIADADVAETGFWKLKESMATHAREHQSLSTGLPQGWSFVKNGTKFDGFGPGKAPSNIGRDVLLDSKSRYAGNLIDDATGQLEDWFKRSNTPDLFKQVQAADGVPIEILASDARVAGAFNQWISEVELSKYFSVVVTGP